MAGKGSGSKAGNLKGSVERFSSSKNRKLLAKGLKQSSSVKGTKNIVAIDPATKQLISGNISSVAKLLKTSPATLKARMSKGKSQFKDVKGFTILNFSSPETMVAFKNAWDPADAKILKEKSKPVLDGAKYLEALQPSFSVVDAGNHTNQKWGTAEHRYKLDLNTDGLTKNQLEQIFSQTSLNTIKEQKLKGKDKIRVVIEDPNLKNGFASIPLMSVKDFSVAKIFKMFEDVVESNQDYQLSSDTQLTFSSVAMPNDFMGAYDENIHKLNKAMKKSIIQIKNKDDKCVARAIATGMCRVEAGTTSKEYDNCKRGRKVQEELADEVLTKCGLPARPLNIDDIKVIEARFHYQITIIDGDDYNNICYPVVTGKAYTPPDDDEKTIYLYKHQGHCDLIANNRVAGFFAKENFCHKCKKTYKKKGCHKCQFKCNMCCRPDCPALQIQDKTFNIHCEICDRYFPHQVCYNNHITPQGKQAESVCEKLWKCQKCKKVLSRSTQPPENHTCGDFLCSNCKEIVPKNHRCLYTTSACGLSIQKLIKIIHS